MDTDISTQGARAEFTEAPAPYYDRVAEAEEIYLYIAPEGIKFPPVLKTISIDDILAAQNADATFLLLFRDLESSKHMPFGIDDNSGMLVCTRNPANQIVVQANLRTHL